jgi:hypothetical protein
MEENMRGLLSCLKKDRIAMAAAGALTVLAGTAAVTGSASAADGHWRGRGDHHWNRGDHRGWDRGYHHHYRGGYYRPAYNWGYYYAPRPVYRTYYPGYYYSPYYYDPGPSVNFGFTFR